ncbi:sensor histidine kinase [Enterovirga aerilata]|uniref:histidine kinase n=1 Tax=Enterovirga aerilata TaxID=2730920 RepID=A0A849I9I9_9HYPH|nr:PAS domain-containing sensor histidine kinase [Enterovirga sp. DB1703]NNM72667.1 PAS domain-containing sensor histidine kinase [Enterovirga sp. DB1703]
MSSIESSSAAGLALGRATPVLAEASIPDGRRVNEFAATRLVAGGLGLACLSPYLAWRGTSSAVDAVLALGLVAPLGAAYLAAQTRRLDLAYAVAAAGIAALVSCVFSGGGALAWPAAIWLAAQPLEALAAGERRNALAAGLVSALACLLLAGGAGAALSVQPQAAPAGIALLFLIAGTMLEGGLRFVRPAPDAAPAPVEAGEEESRLREALGDLVTFHDRQGDVVSASGAAMALTRRPAPALLGTGLFAQVHIPDRPAYLKALSDAASGLGPVTTQFRLVVTPERGPARLVWVEMRAHAAKRAEDRAPVVAVTRDASADRTHAEELEAARLEAVQAAEMKGRFLATVSHELRTPLNAIIGFSELLSADHPFVMAEERRKEYATIIKNSGHHLLEVVNTLLDMSKIESGNFSVAPEPFNLGELANGCCDLMALKAQEGQVRLERQIAPDLPELVADRRACRQILINLLSNAVKFTPAGGAVTLSVRRDGDRVVLSVADDGIGIREADLPRLGDPFFQAGDLHRRPHEGTGLGLSVVRGLVGLHHGTMAIESGPGAGTVVTITLPLAGQVETRQIRPVAVQTTARIPARPAERRSA